MAAPALIPSSLRYYWKSHVAVLLGVAVATAALAGALLVGDSMRGSLRSAAIGRLGRVSDALTAPGFFAQSLADRLGAKLDVPVVPAILAQGGATRADSGARAEQINIYGIPPTFAQLATADEQPLPIDKLAGRGVILNDELARELGAQVGEDVLLRLGKPSRIATETLLGRRDQATATLRVTVTAIVPTRGLGAFALQPQQFLPQSAFVSLETLQRAMDRADEASALLVAASRADTAASLSKALSDELTLTDVGLRVRSDEATGTFAVESDTGLLEPAVESAARAAADEQRANAQGVFAYLANSIYIERPGNPDPATLYAIPYSTVAAIETPPAFLQQFRDADGNAPQPLAPGEIWLNQWAAEDLQAKVGDPIVLSYYVVGEFGALQTRSASFKLAAVIEMEGAGGAQVYTPEYPGITDTKSIADWDPPFPVDLRRVRDKDEAYWDEHRTLPKAFVALADGQRLWAEQPDRLGQLTSLRIQPGDGQELAAARERFATDLRQRLDPAALGLAFRPVRAAALKAGSGSTDFGGLFIGFSLFLIASAAMLVALLFRLGVERRAKQIGLLCAVGYTPRRVARLLAGEGMVVALVGSLLGVAAAVGYAWLMIAGLKSWWAAAVANTPLLELHVQPLSLVIGFVSGLIVSQASILIALRGLTRVPANRLLAGAIGASGKLSPRAGVITWSLLSVGVVAAAALLGGRGAGLAVPAVTAFFGSGVALLVAGLAALRLWLGATPHDDRRTPRPARSVAALGIRNARRSAGRSMLTAGLISSATFVIVALQAFRIDVGGDLHRRDSGSGGFALVARAAIPLQYTFGTADGQAALGLSNDAERLLRGQTVIPLRVRPGDETSCLNLYQPTQPRIIGAPHALIEHGGFTFAGSVTETENPWRLLEAPLADGAIPVIGDEAAVMWQLHSGLGQTLTITDARGRDVKLRFVALLRNSVLQNELVVSEANFGRLFPAISGFGMFLITADDAPPPQLAAALERDLAPYAFDATPAAELLRSFFAVQNTYLSTFQTLGGLGLILGTFGVAAVMLRNTWERRGELALLRAVGYSRRALGGMILVENAALVGAGLLLGVGPALVAIAPQLAQRAADVSWSSLLGVVAGVLVVALGAGAAALAPTLRAPLLPALRSE